MTHPDLNTRAWFPTIADWDFFILAALRRCYTRKEIARAIGYTVSSVNMRLMQLRRQYNCTGTHEMIELYISDTHAHARQP